MKIKAIVCFALCILMLLSFVGCKSETIVKTSNLNDAKPVTEEETDKAPENEASTDTNDTNASEDGEPENEETKDGALSGLKILVDAGHGEFTETYQEAIGPGATQTKPAFVSGTAGSYQTEAEFNLKVALLLKDMLEDNGATVIMTRDGAAAELSNIGRAELGNDNNCDLAVRIHADGSTNTQTHGISMLVPGKNEYITDLEMIATSKLIGTTVLTEVLEITGAANRGVIERTDLTGFNWSEIPSILIECGFMSNPDDDLKLSKPEYQKLLAQGILNGLISYYEAQ